MAAGIDDVIPAKAGIHCATNAIFEDELWMLKSSFAKASEDRQVQHDKIAIIL